MIAFHLSHLYVICETNSNKTGVLSLPPGTGITGSHHLQMGLALFKAGPELKRSISLCLLTAGIEGVKNFIQEWFSTSCTMEAEQSRIWLIWKTFSSVHCFLSKNIKWKCHFKSFHQGRHTQSWGWDGKPELPDQINRSTNICLSIWSNQSIHPISDKIKSINLPTNLSVHNKLSSV